jgi:hypothetical protein
MIARNNVQAQNTLVGAAVSCSGWITAASGFSMSSPAAFQIQGSSNNPWIYGDATNGSYINYDRGGKIWQFVNGGTETFRCSPGAFGITGALTVSGGISGANLQTGGNCNAANFGSTGFVQTNGPHYVGPSFRYYLQVDEANGYADIVFDSGNNNRIRENWTTGTLYFYHGGVATMRLDPNGNLVIRGSLYAQTAPFERTAAEIDELLGPPIPMDAPPPLMLPPPDIPELIELAILPPPTLPPVFEPQVMTPPDPPPPEPVVAP